MTSTLRPTGLTESDGRDALLALQRALQSAVPVGDFLPPSGHDYSATLRPTLAACRDNGRAAIADALDAVQTILPWAYHYPARAGEDTLATRIAFAEFIGPDGPMAAPQARVGFTLIAPHTFYPLHAHPAVELYWVMAGTALWATQRAQVRVPPGGFVLHRSDEAHSMRTFDEPLLALWGWSGDIDTPAFYL